MLIWRSWGMFTSLPKSDAPASAPLTMSRLIADAKMMMKIVDNKKYAMSVHRAAASRITSSMFATNIFMRASCAHQADENILQRRPQRRQLADQSALSADLIEHRVQLLQILDRELDVTVDAL